MKQINNSSLFIALVILIILTSCISQKKLVYLQDRKMLEKKVFDNKKDEEYKIQPNDNLYIKISSLEEKANLIFNGMANRYPGSTNEMGTYLDGYSVSGDGNIDFPLIGRTFVKDMTIDEVKVKIETELDKYIKDIRVVVKLINFDIAILGEVKKPGQYKVHRNKINLFEAIAMAGDLGDFANRNRIKLIRQDKNKTSVHLLDLTDQNIIESRYFYLLPNDIIYAEPLKGKQFTFANFPYSIVFSAISTLILMLNYVN